MEKREIEVKAKIEDMKAIELKIEALGCVLGELVTQDDAIFVNFNGDFTRKKAGTNFLRIRKTKDKVLFTLKQDRENELDCIEKEVEISDADQMRGALGLMGYHEAVRVRKTRRKAKYKDMEICLDMVEGIGPFIEVEKMADGDGNMIQDELFDFLQSLGVKKEDRVLQGYDTLVYLKNKHDF